MVANWLADRAAWRIDKYVEKLKVAGVISLKAVDGGAADVSGTITSRSCAIRRH
jgi:hypothetical protein